jgi:AbiV family abortive infection protein
MKARMSAPALFTGALSAADAIEGARLVRANARRLLDDAKLLLRADRHASAAMMAVMALDELSRFFHPLTIGGLRTPKQLAEAWRQFRGARRDFPWSALQRRPDDPSDSSIADAQLDGMLSFIRDLGARADCVPPGAWVDPASMISAELAASIIGTAELYCGLPVAPRAMEAWLRTIRCSPASHPARGALEIYRKLLLAEGLNDEAAMIGAALGPPAPSIGRPEESTGRGDIRQKRQAPRIH